MKNKTLLGIVCFLLIVIISWYFWPTSKPTQQMPTEVDLDRVTQDSGVSIRRVGVVDDDLATGGKRGIYRVHDSVTGEDYLGVSGINLTPSHPRQDATLPTTP